MTKTKYMHDDRRAARRPSARPADRLRRLKREGCNLLLAGAVSDATATRATRRLLGSTELDRKRVLVVPGGTAAGDLLPSGVSADDPAVSVVAYDAAGPESLPDLAGRAAEAVRGYAAADGLVGGELRLAVASLGALVDDHDVRDVEAFLRRVTAAVRDARGIGQYRYAGPRADLPFRPGRLFDGAVSLRDRSGAEQRLSFPSGESTDWVAL
jgi:hypothetical protein